MTNEEILALAERLDARRDVMSDGLLAQSAAALRQLVEELDAIKKRYLDGVSCSGRLTDKGYMPDCQWLREERDREERLLRNKWSLYSLRGQFVLEHDDLRFVTHPDRAEAARMAEEKEK